MSNNRTRNVELEDSTSYVAKNEGGQNEVKIVIIGDSCVGKTTICSVFANGETLANPVATSSVDVTSRIILINSEKIKLTIIDTAGQEKYYPVSLSYMGNINCSLIVFDLTSRSSLDVAMRRLMDVRTRIKAQIPIFLVGNKNESDYDLDLEQKAKNMAIEAKIQYYSVSAYTNSNIRKVFLDIINESLNNHEKPAAETDLNVNSKPPREEGQQETSSCLCQ